MTKTKLVDSAGATQDVEVDALVDSGSARALSHPNMLMDRVDGAGGAFTAADGRKMQAAAEGALQVMANTVCGSEVGMRLPAVALSNNGLTAISVRGLCDGGASVTFEAGNNRITLRDGQVVPFREGAGGAYVLTCKLRPPCGDGQGPISLTGAGQQTAAVSAATHNSTHEEDSADQSTAATVLHDQEPNPTAAEEQFDKQAEPSTASPGDARTQGLRDALERDAHRAKSWHAVHVHAGHPGEAVTDKLVRSGALPEITDCRTPPPDEDKFCETCCKCKITRARVGKGPAPRALTMGTVWHCDLHHADAEGEHGEKYCFVAVEDVTGMLFVFPIVRKNETVEALQELVAQTRAAAAKAGGAAGSLSVVARDGGSEFDGSFKEHCKQLGIHNTITSRYTPEHNGREERAGRTLFEKEAVMREGANMPPSSWPHAVRAAASAYNVLPRQRRESPHQEIFGEPGPLHRLREFGCLAMMKGRVNEPRAVKVQVLGLAANGAGWTVRKLSDGRILDCRDIVFGPPINKWQPGRNEAEVRRELGEPDNNNQQQRRAGRTGGGNWFALPPELLGDFPDGGDGSGPPGDQEEVDQPLLQPGPAQEEQAYDDEQVKYDAEAAAQPGCEVGLSDVQRRQQEDMYDTVEVGGMTKSRTSITRTEAQQLIQRAREQNLAIQWTVDKPKSGKSGERQAQYTRCKTIGEFDALVERDRRKPRDAKAAFAADLLWDVMKGLCKFSVSAPQPAPVATTTTDEESQEPPRRSSRLRAAQERSKPTQDAAAAAGGHQSERPLTDEPGMSEDVEHAFDDLCQRLEDAGDEAAPQVRRVLDLLDDELDRVRASRGGDRPRSA